MGGAFFTLLYFLPIYFQSVQGVSASNSGIRNLPLIISMSTFPPHISPHLTHPALCIIASGGILTAIGFAPPFLILGSALTSIGCGLLYTLDVHSASGHWIGYQILTGIGLGVCFQIPIMYGQATATMDDVPVVTAMLMCTPTPPYPFRR